MTTTRITAGIKAPKKFPKLKQFWRNIAYMQGQEDIRNAQMAKIMGISVATFQNRKNKPQFTTGAEMERAAEFFKGPLEYLFRPLISDQMEDYYFRDDDDEETS